MDTERRKRRFRATIHSGYKMYENYFILTFRSGNVSRYISFKTCPNYQGRHVLVFEHCEYLTRKSRNCDRVNNYIIIFTFLGIFDHFGCVSPAGDMQWEILKWFCVWIFFLHCRIIYGHSNCPFDKFRSYLKSLFLSLLVWQY